MVDIMKFTNPDDRTYAEIIAEMDELNVLRKQLNDNNIEGAEEINSLFDRIEAMVVGYAEH